MDGRRRRSPMTSPLLAWLEEPREDRGIRFAEDDGGWRLATYADLAARTREAAARLAGAGVGPGEVVSIVVPSGPQFVAAYFGALLAGAIPSPLVPPTIIQDPEQWADHTSRLIATASSHVVTEAELLSVARDAAGRAGLAREPFVLEHDGGGAEPPARPPAELALLQFTSGSSGTPRGVRVTWDNLVAMIDYIFEWVPWGPDDAGGHWLPLYHDFGLIGCLLAPATRQRDLWILRPEQFIRWPERWMDCFGREGAAFAAAPSFAFSYVLRKVDPARYEGQDFSGWRGAIIGAERIDPAVLERFAAMLEPHGFRRETYMTAYGMAETTLGVTGVPADEVPRALRVDWASLELGRPVGVLDRARVGAPEIGDGTGWLVSCGRPHAGLSLRALDADGRPLPDGHLGELEVEGPTVADGYVGEAGGRMTSFTPSGLRTGDAGFVVDGELYVVGRLGDAVKLRGRSVYAEDLEARLGAIDGVPRGRCVIIPGAREGGEALVAIVETAPGEWSQRALRVLAREAGPEARVEVYSAQPATIPRTSSGKPRRRVLWERFARGEVELERVAAAGGERIPEGAA